MTKKNKEPKRLRKFIIFLILIIGLILIYARYVGTAGLVVREYIIESPKITTNFDGLKIVHFSDLHYGTTVMAPQLENIIEQINSLKPDIVFFTGDLFDKHYNPSKKELDKVIALFNKLAPNITSYFIRGDHDNSANYEKVIEGANLQLLNNENTLFYYHDLTPLLIVGIDDLLIGKPDLTAAFINATDIEHYTIVLAHEPDIIKQLSDYKIDLFLSGHSHNGQVRLPLVGAIIKPEGAKLYYDAEYKLKDTQMFISGGLGTSKYPLRLFNKPSFNLYRFLVK